MHRKLAILSFLSILCLWLPLMRFFASPTWETARAVDIALVFAAGLAAGALLTAGFTRLRS